MELNFVKEETYNDAVTYRLSEHYEEILKELGEDLKREGLLKTPERVAKAMQYMTHGYGLNPDDLINQAIFHEEYSEMVIVKDIEVYSMCEHHMLPFFGKAHVAYIPEGKIVGLSKIPRVVDAYARRLQVQERLTIEIRDCIQRTLNPKGVAVVIERTIRKDPLFDEALEPSDERCRGVTSHRALAAEGIDDLLHLGERDLWRHRGVHAREHEEFPAALLKGVGALFGHVRVEMRAQPGQPSFPRVRLEDSVDGLFVDHTEGVAGPRGRACAGLRSRACTQGQIRVPAITVSFSSTL